MSPESLVAGAGGKWTTYRLMAQDAVDAAVRYGNMSMALPCATTGLRLVGGHGYTSALFTEVAQSYVVPHRPGAIDTRVAKHLACEPHFPSPPAPYTVLCILLQRRKFK